MEYGRPTYELTDVSHATCPCTPPEEIVETMSAREQARYTEEIAVMWAEFLPHL